MSTASTAAVQLATSYPSLAGQAPSTTLNTENISNSSNAQPSYSYQSLLGRIPQRPDGTPNHEPSSFTYQENDRVIAILLQQPPEIRNMILNYLEVSDLLNLRATSHNLHNLIHDSGKALCLALASQMSRSHHLSHLQIAINDLSDFLRIRRQYDSICNVAAIIAERIVRHLKSRRVDSEDREALQAFRASKRRRIEPRLIRAMIVLQQYLNFFLETLNLNEQNLQPLADDEYTTLNNIFDLDQQEFMAKHMSRLSEKDFIDITATLNIFKLTCKARCVPFMLKSQAHPFASVRQILVYKGFAAFADLLEKGVGSAQQEAIMRRLSIQIGQGRRPGSAANHRPPCASIHALEEYHRSCHLRFDQKRSSKARDIFISHQDIWDRAARALMMPKLGRLPNIQSATTWIQKVVASDERQSDIIIGAWDQPESR